MLVENHYSPDSFRCCRVHYFLFTYILGEIVAANDTQVGGTHYQTDQGEQHWDLMWRLFREAWFVGNITKYVLRYKRKHGIEDLKKAMHYLQKLLELEEADAAKSKGSSSP
jgi:hypothetical protein